MNSYMFPSVLHLQTQEFWSKAISGSCSYESSPCQLSSAKHVHELTPMIPKRGKQIRVESTRTLKSNSLKDQFAQKDFFFLLVSYQSNAQFIFTTVWFLVEMEYKKFTEVLASVQNHLSKKKRFTERQSFKDIFVKV